VPLIDTSSRAVVPAAFTCTVTLLRQQCHLHGDIVVAG